MTPRFEVVSLILRFKYVQIWESLILNNEVSGVHP